jgi:hypothetical protein
MEFIPIPGAEIYYDKPFLDSGSSPVVQYAAGQLRLGTAKGLVRATHRKQSGYTKLGIFEAKRKSVFLYRRIQ